METNNKVTPPKHGYILEKWGQIGYRATALAYMQREGLARVQNEDGKWYDFEDVNNAIIRPKYN
jgi:hypothetical protein